VAAPEGRLRRGVLSWSGGKDSALALLYSRRQGWAIRWLLTTVTEPYARVSMHGVRLELLEAQAEAVGVALRQVPIPAPCTNAEYEERMGRAVGALLGQGADGFVFGDLFLADIRAYREEQLARVGATARFPLWGKDTGALAREFVRQGFRAHLCAVDPRRLDRSFAGAAYDEALLARLPANVDACGENGEFHTFVHDGPVFAHPVPVAVGEVVERDGFVFADLLPARGGG
jgi:uncharacterized protein (TIGR00290 family)